MPVVVEVLPENEFMAWVNEAKNNFAVNEDLQLEEEQKEITISKNIIQLEEKNL